MRAETSASARILITGRSGQVGGALFDELSGTAEIYAPGSAEMDLGDEKSIRDAVRAFRPDWIVNAAAYTKVDKAEAEPEIAYRINAEAPRIFAEEAQRLGAPLLHFSTDYVFDGSKPTPYIEDDPTAPLNIYGKSKRAGEKALEQSNAAFLNFRTSWVYGATGKNFLRTILKAAHERGSLRIVDDQHGAPTWSRDLARMMAYVVRERSAAAVQQGSSIAEAVRAVRGIYHAACAEETTWFGFAETAINSLQASVPEQQFATLERVATADYPTAARRPLNSRLDSTKLKNVFGWSMPHWQESLVQVLCEMNGDC